MLAMSPAAGLCRLLFAAAEDPQLGLAATAPAPRRHIATFHDTVPEGIPDGAQLPIDGRKGGTVRLHIGPGPREGHAHLILGLADRKDAAGAQFEILCNGHPCRPIADYEHPEEFPGVARALRFICMIGALLPGYNDLQIKQTAGAGEQQVVRVELRIEPDTA